MNLFQSFQALPIPSRPGTFTAERTGTCRVARSFEGHPAFLVELTARNGLGVPRRLANISYDPPAPVEVIAADGTAETRHIAILRCVAVDTRLASYFFRVTTSILYNEAASGDEARFEAALDTLISLFRSLQRPGIRSIQGLWSELALLAWSTNCAAAISAWHSSARAVHDFVAGNLRLEAKSTATGLREHTFSLDQLMVPEGGATLVASMLLEPSELGHSIHDLALMVRDRLGGDAEAVRRLETIVADSLGSAFEEAHAHRYDLARARENLMLFRAEQIPSITLPLPPEVKRVQLTVDLSSTPSMVLDAARAVAPFYADLLPCY